MYSRLAVEIIIKIGLPPAGGCKNPDIIIRRIAKPTAKPIAKKLDPKIIKTKTPEPAEIRCPKKIFLGLASGLSGKAVINTTEAPKVGIIHNIYSLEIWLK